MKIIKITFLMFLVITVCTSFVCAQPASYTAEDTGLTFYYPDGWQVNYDNGFFWIVQDPANASSPAVAIEIMDTENTPALKDLAGSEDFRDFVLEYYEYNEYYNELMIGEKTYNEDTDVAYAYMTYKSTDEFEVAGSYKLKDGKGFAVTYEAPSTSFDPMVAKEILDMIINSMHFSN